MLRGPRGAEGGGGSRSGSATPAEAIDQRREPDVGVDFAVDDDPSVVESYGGCRVQPFGGGPCDEEPLGVPDGVDASGSWSRALTLPRAA
jgi:hypothetical protein